MNAEALYVTVSIDTEVDHDPAWARSDPLTFDSLTVGVPERLQPVFEAIGAVPTYLLTVEVLEHDASVATLQGLSARGVPHELGTHLHAAFVEPDKKFHDYAGVDSPDFQCCLAPDVERAKLATLTALFRSRFGHAPTSFRAGRYGAGPNTIDALESLGYRVDTSVTPRLRWREPAGSVDFRRAPLQPYRPAAGSIAEPAPSGTAPRGRLLEVPVTVRPRPLRRTPAWFRPWSASVDDMRKTVRWHVDRARGEPVCLNMMFHSMEVIEAASPYPQSAADVARYLDDMRTALEHCAELGARFVPLSALDEIWPR